MDKTKIIAALREILEELEKPDTVVGTRGDINKFLEEIKAMEAQNPPESPRPTEDDIKKMIERKWTEDKRKYPQEDKPYWMDNSQTADEYYRQWKR